MGPDPKGDITSMVCGSFKPGSKSASLIGDPLGIPNGQGPDEQRMVDKSGGSGKYKAHYIDAGSLTNHTLNAPENTPP
jgi:hypothetical protein